MKKIYFLLLALGLFTGVNAQIINFPDANFKAKLLSASSSNQIASSATTFINSSPTSYNKIDINNDGEIQISEASNITWLNISSSSISNLTGISFFMNN